MGGAKAVGGQARFAAGPEDTDDGDEGSLWWIWVVAGVVAAGAAGAGGYLILSNQTPDEGRLTIRW